MAWLSGPNPFSQENKNHKNLTLKRKKFTKTKAKEILKTQIQDSCQFSPKFTSRHDATAPERSWSQLPNHKEIILGFVLIVSPQESSQEKGALQCRRPQKRAPSRPEKERKDLLELFSDF